jgi:hypothetical protein
MSNQRYDVLSPRKYKSGGQEKTFWDKVGVAFESKNRDGFDITLHSVPMPQPGQDGALSIRLMARVPKERDGQQSRGGGQQGGGYEGGSTGAGDDEIPF